MATLEVFFDYTCPYCLKGHQSLVELIPNYPDIEVAWRPCEAHPRPEEYGRHSDLCIRAMFFAQARGAELWAWHKRLYALCLEEDTDIEDPAALAAAVKDLVDEKALLAALQSGAYTAELARANDYAYEENDVWVIPAYRMAGRRLDAEGGVGVSTARLKAFLDGE